MEEFSRYILSVVSAALVVGIILDLSGRNGSTHIPLRLICGLFMMFAVVSPVVNLDFSSLNSFFEDFSVEGSYYAESGESGAYEAYRSIIKSKTEAYILDKAAALQADIETSVTLSKEEPAVPVSIWVKGKVSPYAKSELSRFLEEELGIAKEYQKWTG